MRYLVQKMVIAISDIRDGVSWVNWVDAAKFRCRSDAVEFMRLTPYKTMQLIDEETGGVVTTNCKLRELFANRTDAVARDEFMAELRELTGVSEQYADAAWYTTDVDFNAPRQAARRYAVRFGLIKGD